MRNGIRLFLLSLLVVGCASTSPTRSNSQYLRELYDAFARGDVPTVLAGFDPDIVWNEAESSAYASGNPYRGPQAIVQGIFMRLGTEWNDYRVKPDQFIDGGDTVAVAGRYSATFKSTGRPLDAPFVHVWTFRNGKVVGFRQYTDTAQFNRVMTPSR
jgi:uncharacterized protein